MSHRVKLITLFIKYVYPDCLDIRCANVTFAQEDKDFFSRRDNKLAGSA